MNRHRNNEHWRLRREYQAKQRLSIGIIRYTCGCGAYLGQEGDKSEPCSSCKSKSKIQKRLKIKLHYGFCVCCGDLAPGLCYACEAEILRGRIPRL